MTTHELAKQFHQLATELETCPPANLSDHPIHVWVGSVDKETLVDFAKHCKPTTKAIQNTGSSIDTYTLRFGSGDLKLDVYAYRSEVCTIVKPAQPAVYECEPLLSMTEEQELGVS